MSFSGPPQSNPARAPSVVAIGNFDGVHRGHQALLGRAAAEARSLGLQPLALTFHPHPREVLGQTKRAPLTSIERKVALLRRLGLGVEVEPFTLELSRLSPTEFAERVLVQRLSARVVLVGENFRFGRDRAGDLAELERLGARLGFQARAEPLVADAEGPFSSTRARAAVERGDLPAAERCLGRPHSTVGTVVAGDGRGRTIGVPTANLADVVELLPPYGVYACLVDRETAPGEGVALARGVANIGVRPTVAAGFAVEVHLLDFEGDLYGARLRVHWVARLREERRFESLEALTAQIREDMRRARDVLAERAPEPAARGAWA